VSRLTSPAADLMFRKARERIFRNSSSDIGSKGLSATREIPPKWKSLLEVLTESKELFDKRDSSLAVGDCEHTVDSPSTGKSVNGRVIVFVKDERTALQMRDVLAFGVESVIDQRHRWFVSQQAAQIKNSVATHVKASSQTAPERKFSEEQTAILQHVIAVSAILFAFIAFEFFEFIF